MEAGQELTRVLKPAGEFVVVEHLRDTVNFLAYTTGFSLSLAAAMASYLSDNWVARGAGSEDYTFSHGLHPAQMILQLRLIGALLVGLALAFGLLNRQMMHVHMFSWPLPWG